MLTTSPLSKFEELWNWDESTVPDCLVGEPLINYSRNHYPQTLVCHDMKGGYLDEEKLDGCEVADSQSPFVFFHWWYIDIFVYFSHNFVTIPPVGWINQAHMHGVIVLGTVITEWDDGAKLCKEFLKNEETVVKIVRNLVKIAVYYNFDGWLINIENKLEEDCLTYLDIFLQTLTNKMRQAIGERSRVIWYDSVTVKGELKWQNELNEENQKWFDITDGIFLNYIWDNSHLSRSSVKAKHRTRDVFVGIDCFGRQCFGGGGWNSHKAFTYPRLHNLSIALFAPGWIIETMPRRDITVNALRFWDRLVTFVKPHPLTTLPIDSNFSFGLKYENGCKYYCLTEAKMQPHYLESGAFPASYGMHIDLPGQASYRLFVTNLLLNGVYVVKADCDDTLGLVFWKKDKKGKEVENIQQKVGKVRNMWNLHIENETVVGIGVLSSNSTILRSFVLRPLSPIIDSC